MTLGEKMLKFRAKNNLTQQQFAKIAGVSNVTVVNIEAEKGCSKITEAKLNLILEEK